MGGEGLHMVQESLVTLRCMFIVLMLNQLKYSLHYIIIKVLSYLKSFDQVCRKKCIKVYHANLVLLDSSYNTVVEPRLVLPVL
jgi:hypothetical protein